MSIHKYIQENVYNAYKTVGYVNIFFYKLIIVIPLESSSKCRLAKSENHIHLIHEQRTDLPLSNFVVFLCIEM